MTRILGSSYSHPAGTHFVTETVDHADDFATPRGRCCQDNLPTETLECLKKNHLMTAQRTYPSGLKTGRATADNNGSF